MKAPNLKHNYDQKTFSKNEFENFNKLSCYRIGFKVINFKIISFSLLASEYKLVIYFLLKPIFKNFLLKPNPKK